MKKAIDKIVTGIFVVIFGTVWYFSTKQYVSPSKYNIIVNDSVGKIISPKYIRLSFKTQEVAYSYIKEYEKLFPQYNFSLEVENPEVKYIIFNKILNKNIQR